MGTASPGGTALFIDGFVQQLPDIDPQETGEWLDSLDSVLDVRGKSRARYLLTRLMERARAQGIGVPSAVSTPYLNTIPPEQEPWFPGDEDLVQRRGRRVGRQVTAEPVETTGSAVTCRPTRRPRRCTRSGSTTSSGARLTAGSATRCSCRVTPRLASTPA